MKENNKKTGNKGEDLAVKFLNKKGFLIVERNFSTRFGEIDIVCLDGKKLVFVEVKTKIGHKFGEPEDMVSKAKLMQVQRMGEVFIEVNSLNNKDLPRTNFSTRLPPLRTAQRGYLRQNLPETMSFKWRNYFENWKGGCRVDVIGVILTEDGEVEEIRHHEGVY